MSIDALAAISASGLGYLIGSLPFGYLVARSQGVDIFTVGSRNPGATNVKRCVGKRAGNIVFTLDALKGFAAAFWPFVAFASPNESPAIYGILGLVFAVLGHSFSMFTRFRGGKGVATMLGGLAALMPLAALIGVAVWLLVFFSTRYVSLASICLAASLPISNLLLDQEPLLTWVSLGLALLVVARHRDNIARLLRGEENKFERKSAATRGITSK